MTGAPGQEPGGVEHAPVLLDAALDALAIRPDGCYVDATFGRGGHAGEILGRLGTEGKLIAFDRDPDASAAANRLFDGDSRARFIRARFSGLLAARGACERGRHPVRPRRLLAAIRQPERGFSFLRDGPLDMRMDPQAGESAAEWLRAQAASARSRW